MLTVFVLLSLSHCVPALFSTDFTQWLDENYDIGKRQWLERNDVAHGRGSFGGRNDENETLTHNPIIFVHGVSNVAGQMMMEAASYYRKTQNYTFAEMYATSYDNPSGDQLKWIQYTMKCDHVQRIRFLIEAVHNYTERPVDVVAFSLGVPITRKAIMGGDCVDGGSLGGNITHKMGTFVGVSGPNKGVAPVIMGMPFAACALSPLIPICNPTDGLFSGFCPFKSRFIDDINRLEGYEGQKVYSIGSTSDEVVGHVVCMEVTTRINAQDGEKIYNDKKHDATFRDSFDVQLAMLSGKPF